LTRFFQGASSKKAFQDSLSAGVSNIDFDLRIRQAMYTLSGKGLDTVKQFGQACNIGSALPGDVYTILCLF